MMNRKHAPVSAKRQFSRTAARVHRRNIHDKPMRGGFRL